MRSLYPGCWRLEQEQLYAIDRDPQMSVDLLESSVASGRDARGTAYPKRVAAELARILEDWREQHRTLRDPNPDPMEARATRARPMPSTLRPTGRALFALGASTSL